MDSISPAPQWIVISFIHSPWVKRLILHAYYNLTLGWGTFPSTCYFGLARHFPSSSTNEDICGEKQMKASHPNIIKKFQSIWTSMSHKGRGMRQVRDITGEVAGATASAWVPRKKLNRILRMFGGQ